jgi:hypothetical protein
VFVDEVFGIQLGRSHGTPGHAESPRQMLGA